MADRIMTDSSPMHSPILLPLRPADEAKALLSQAQEVKILHPTLRSIVIKHKDLFLNVFNRQINLIKSRSQALEDVHITVYDKVLLELTANGNNLLAPAAVTWYCTEYFGFNVHVAEEHNVHAIKQSLALPVALSQDSRAARSPDIHHQRPSPQKMLSPHPTSPVGQRATVASSQDESRFSHYWKMYDKAVKDFNEFGLDTDTRAFEAARWLRDTAENGVHFLERREHPNAKLIGNLKAAYTKAQRRVEDLSGGRKRKFDHHADLMERKRMKVLEEEESLYDAFDAQYQDQEHTNMISPRAQSPPPPSSVRDSLQDRDYRYYGAGRGPSGVPYGYGHTRFVDSYIPSRDRREPRWERSRSRSRSRDRSLNRDRELSRSRGRRREHSYRPQESDSEKDSKHRQRD